MSYIQGEGRSQGTLFPVVLDDLMAVDELDCCALSAVVPQRLTKRKNANAYLCRLKFIRSPDFFCTTSSNDVFGDQGKKFGKPADIKEMTIEFSFGERKRHGAAGL
jgi:hypothetical protein